MARWRLALRLAHRDARRNRARSLLVVALIGLPVALLSGMATLAATDAAPTAAPDGPDARADAEVVVLAGPETDTEAWLGDLPAGVRAAPFDEGVLFSEVGGQRRQLDVWRMPLDDPLAARDVDLVAGDPPREDGEMAVSRRVAEAADVGPGDEFVLDDPAVDDPADARVVTGVVEWPAALRREAVVLAPDAPMPAGVQMWSPTWGLDAGGIDLAEVADAIGAQLTSAHSLSGTSGDIFIIDLDAQSSSAGAAAGGGGAKRAQVSRWGSSPCWG